MRQVITISPTGELSGLQVKPGKGVDLRQFGKANISRASDILFSEGEQKWFVSILRGRYAGLTVTKEAATGAVLDTEHMPLMRHALFDGTTAYFNEYEDAVNSEIMVLNAVRLQEGADSLN